MQTQFKQYVQSVYVQEQKEENYEVLRKEFINDFDASSSRVKENILKSHGCLNLVNTSDFDLLKQQLYRVDNSFYDSNPHTQGCIIHYYMPQSWD